MFRSIRSKILCATFVIVLVSLVVNTTLNYCVSRTFTRNSIAQSLTSLLTAHDAGVAEWVSSKMQMIMSLEDACARDDDPTSSLRQVAAAGGFTNVYVGLANKTAHFADATGVPKDFDPTGRPWYREAAEAGRPVVLRPYLDMGTGKLVVSFAAPILRNGNLVGVVSGDIAMDSVVSNVTSVRPTPNSFGLLVDRAGTIVAYADQRLTQKPMTEIFPDLRPADIAVSAANADSAPMEVQGGPLKETKLLRARAVPGTDWFVIVALDKSEATAGIHSLLLVSLVSLAVLVGIAAGITGYLTTVIFKRLAVVRNAMEAIGSGTGDLTQRLPVGGMDEVGQIASSFNRFVSKLNEVMLLIRDSSNSVKLAATEIASGNHDLSRRTEAAAASLQQTAASMEEITSTVTQAANAARQANEKASTAVTRPPGVATR
jgi:methyl-accepting chemotaxis protein